MFLNTLYNIIEERKENPEIEGYTRYLFDQGLDKILKKIGEEASEVIIASKNQEKEALVSEVADLMYHLTVLLVEKGVTYGEVEAVLIERQKNKNRP